MAWELRDGRRYYYSATRRGGRVEKTYHGPGVVGELAAGVVAGAKRRRSERAAALASEKARRAPLDRVMETLDEACLLMMEATFSVAGYHKHDYSWRRRRVRLEDPNLGEATE